MVNFVWDENSIYHIQKYLSKSLSVITLKFHDKHKSFTSKFCGNDQMIGNFQLAAFDF